jgi:hypothetical protein
MEEKLQVSLFTQPPRPKRFNDIDNKNREIAIEQLFSKDAGTSRKLISSPQDGKIWQKIRENLHNVLSDFISKESGVDLVDTSLFLVKKGGRKFNFDFLGFFEKNGKIVLSELKIEFKGGKSIYDQPQFWSPYANKTNLLNTGVQAYYESFYENFIAEAASMARVNVPNFQVYEDHIFSTKYESHPYFEELYRLSTNDPESKSKLQKIADRSIDFYLSDFLVNTNYVNYISLQEKLLEQKDKYFLSWDFASFAFRVQRFSDDDVMIKGNVTHKRNRTGLINALVFSNQANHSISALLRWKNHPCVLSPAWQISLHQGSV